MDNGSKDNVEDFVHVKPDQTLFFDSSFDQCAHYWHVRTGDVSAYFRDLSVLFLSSLDLRFWKLITFEILWMIFSYVLAVKWTYSYLMGKCTCFRERIVQKKTDIADLETKLEMLELKIQQRHSESVEKSAELQLKMNRYIKLRGRVRELLATDAMRNLLKHIVIWDDISMNGGGDDANISMMMEMFHNLNYEQPILPDKTTHAPYNQNEENFHSVSSQSSGDARPREKESLKLVKVTNIYKLGLRHQSRHVKVKNLETGSLHKKKADNIKKLLEEWHASLNSVVEKKMAECKLVQPNQTKTKLIQRELDVATKNAEFENFHDDLETGNIIDFKYDVAGETDLLYGPEWSQNGCQLMPYGTQDPRKLVDMDNMDMMYGPTQCECNGPQGSKVLFILPEETRSQIEISEIEERKYDDFEFDLLN